MSRPTFPWGFPGNSAGKESTCNAEDPGSIPVSGRSPGEGIGYPIQYSSLENFMDGPWSGKELDMNMSNMSCTDVRVGL